MDVYRDDEIMDLPITKEILVRWQTIANTIGITIDALIHLAMHNYEKIFFADMDFIVKEEKSIYPNIEKTLEFINTLKTKIDSIPKLKIKIRCDKCKRYYTEKSLEIHLKTCEFKPKPKLEIKCPNCSKMIDNRGFYNHKIGCKPKDKISNEIVNKEKKNNAKMPIEKLNRLRQYRKYADAPRDGRMVEN